MSLTKTFVADLGILIGEKLKNEAFIQFHVDRDFLGLTQGLLENFAELCKGR